MDIVMDERKGGNVETRHTDRYLEIGMVFERQSRNLLIFIKTNKLFDMDSGKLPHIKKLVATIYNRKLKNTFFEGVFHHMKV